MRNAITHWFFFILIVLIPFYSAAQGESDSLRYITGEAAREDMREYISLLERVHPDLLSKVKVSDYIIMKRKAFADIDLISKAEGVISVNNFARIVCSFGAFFQDGHTNIWGWLSTTKKDWASPFGGILGNESSIKYPPFTLRFENGKFYIQASVKKEIKGAEILKINALSVSKFIHPIFSLISGETSAFKAYSFAESQNFWYSFTGLFSNIPSFEIEIRGEKQQIRSYKVETISASEFKGLQSNTEIPEKEGRLKKGTQVEFFDSGKIAYLSYPEFVYKEEELKKIDDAFKVIQQKKPKELIIDLRGNGGGSSPAAEYVLSYLYPGKFHVFSRIRMKISHDVLYPSVYYASMLENLTSKEFAKKEHDEILEKYSGVEGLTVTEWQPEETYKKPGYSFTGKVYVLIDNGTFSTAVAFASIIRDYKIGKLIGNETGGVPIAYGNPLGFKLKNSGITGGVSWKQFLNPKPQQGDDEHGIIPDIKLDGKSLQKLTDKNDPEFFYTIGHIIKSR